MGAFGALVSSWTVWVWSVETLPTLSSAIHLIVVVPSAVTSKEADVVSTVVAVPLVAGSVPSVVYVIRLTPDSPVSPPVVIDTDTGELVYQPAEQVAELQLIALVGADESACAVKLVPVLERPALFCAVTEPDCVPAVASKV